MNWCNFPVFQVEYLVQWESTWEPEHRIYCPSLVEKYENKKKEEEEEQAMNKEENTTSDEEIISVGDEKIPPESTENSTRDKYTPEDADEPDEFIDIIYRKGLYYFVMLWKGSNKASLIPVITGNILYPELVKKYLAANDSD